MSNMTLRISGFHRGGNERGTLTFRQGVPVPTVVRELLAMEGLALAEDKKRLPRVTSVQHRNAGLAVGDVSQPLSQ